MVGTSFQVEYCSIAEYTMVLSWWAKSESRIAAFSYAGPVVLTELVQNPVEANCWPSPPTISDSFMVLLAMASNVKFPPKLKLGEVRCDQLKRVSAPWSNWFNTAPRKLSSSTTLWS